MPQDKTQGLAESVARGLAKDIEDECAMVVKRIGWCWWFFFKNSVWKIGWDK